MATKKVAGSRLARNLRDTTTQQVQQSASPVANSTQHRDSGNFSAKRSLDEQQDLSAEMMSRMQQELSRLAKKIIQLRRAKGISQEELAYRAGLSRNGMGSIEQGKCWPRLKTLLRISAALDSKIEI